MAVWDELSTAMVFNSHVSERHTSRDLPLPVATPVQPLKCLHCARLFARRKTLKRHLRTVHASRTYPCSCCSRTFSRNDVRRRHEREQHKDETGTIECMFCGSHVRERALTGHMESQRCKDTQHAINVPQINGTAIYDEFWIAELRPMSDPLLLCAHLVLQCGLQSRSYSPVYSNGESAAATSDCSIVKPTIELLELQNYVTRSILEQTQADSYDCRLLVAVDVLSQCLEGMYGPIATVQHRDRAESFIEHLTNLHTQGLDDEQRYRFYSETAKNAFGEALLAAMPPTGHSRVFPIVLKHIRARSNARRDSFWLWYATWER